jgi:serine protease AprX
MTIASYVAETHPANQVAESYYDTTPPSKLALTNSLAYFQMSATSTATPVVSGTAALMLGKTSSLTPDQVKAPMTKTANKLFPATSVRVNSVTGIRYTSQYGIFAIAAGYLNVWAAMNDTDRPSGVEISPAVSFNTITGALVSNFTDPSAIWWTSAIWGTSAIWWTNVFTNWTSAIWGTPAIWGNNTTQAFSASMGHFRHSGYRSVRFGNDRH